MENGLFSLENYELKKQDIFINKKWLVEVMGLFEKAVDNDLVKRADRVMDDLLRTRGEQLLLSLYSVDGLAQFSADQRDVKTRGVRTLLGGAAKFKKIFKPVLERATLAMKGK